jgi:hypothetical protein
VRGQKHRHAGFLLQPAHRSPDVLPSLRVKAGRRLVEKKDLWRVDERARDVRAPPLASRKLAVWPIEKILRLRGLCRRFDGAFELFSAKAVQAAAHG